MWSENDKNSQWDGVQQYQLAMRFWHLSKMNLASLLSPYLKPMFTEYKNKNPQPTRLTIISNCWWKYLSLLLDDFSFKLLILYNRNQIKLSFISMWNIIFCNLKRKITTITLSTIHNELLIELRLRETVHLCNSCSYLYTCYLMSTP